VGRVREASRSPLIAAGAVPVLAALSLIAPWAPSFDPWGWILWGREIAHPGLLFSTAGYPSWKPLPVVFTTAFSLADGVAPALWLAFARAGALASLVLAWVFAARLSTPVAGAIAVAGIVLAPHWLTDFAGGASEPLLCALVLGAIERQVAGRSGQALGLWTGAALLRPEAWPFLLAYGGWRAGRHPRRWLGLVLIVLLVAGAWFVPEWIGAGDPLHGSKLAQASHEARQTRALAAPLLGVLRDGLGLLVLPLWLGLAVAVLWAIKEAQRLPLWLAGTAAAWVAVVLALTAVGYAGIARFMLPAAVIAAVVGAAGTHRLATDVLPGHRLLAIALLTAIIAPFAATRAVGLADQAATATLHRSLQRQLWVLLDRLGGRAGVRACGPMLVKNEFRGSMAWKLGVPEAFLRGRNARLYLRRHGHPLPGFPPRHARRLVTVARAGPWSAIRLQGSSVSEPRPARCA
jgi:hypothetical protein